MGRRGHVGILIAYGPEARAFIHSGLAARLGEYSKVSFIGYNLDSQVFEGIDSSVLEMPRMAEGHRLARARQLARHATDAWVAQHGNSRWGIYRPYQERNAGAFSTSAILALLARHRRGVRALGRFEHSLARVTGTVPEWRRLFETSDIDCLIATSYYADRVLPALQTAYNLGLATAVVTNSWKDAYVNPHLAVPVDKLMVWSGSIAEYLIEANPGLSLERLTPVGSLHLQRFLSPAAGDILSRSEFCSRSGLDPRRPIVCYTAGNPTIGGKEPEIVGLLAEAIRRNHLPGRPQMLVRVNTMEDGSRFKHLVNSSGGVVLQRPDWEWEESLDWNCPLAHDAETWLATVAHSAVNVSLSSTVSLEFAALGRPVVNVAFDLPKNLAGPESNRRFWDSSFYANIRETGYPVAAFSPAEMLDLVRSYVGGDATTTSPEGLFATRDPVKVAAEEIEELLA